MGAASSKVFFKDLTVGHDIGKGAFGIVKIATHKSSKERFAVKMSKLETAELLHRAGQEHRMLQDVSGHPNITKYFSFDIADEMACLVMEYCEEGNLKDYCLRSWPDENTAGLFCRQMANGLKHMHHHRIAHTDLKPDNILIHKGVCKISDMGVARTFEDLLDPNTFYNLMSSSSTFSHGKPVFWAPEIIQLRMENHPQPDDKKLVRIKCDVFSLGLIALVLFKHEVIDLPDGKQTVGLLLDDKCYGSCSQSDIDAAVVKSGVPSKLQNGVLSMLKVDEGERASAASAYEGLDKTCSVM